MAHSHVSAWTGPTPGLSVYAALAAFPVAGFSLALLMDVAYWRTENLFWQNMASWLLLAGLVGGGLAAIAWLFVRRRAAGWLQGLVALLSLVAALFNSLVHAGDGWTGVMPWGLALSVVTVLLMLGAAILGTAPAHTSAREYPR